MTDAPRPYITNCFLVSRHDSDVMFTLIDGQIVPTLDRYAIVPREEYEALRRASDQLAERLLEDALSAKD